MKKTLTVNLGGTVFHIDEDAYQLLDKYLANLRIHFRREEGADEIMTDFEARISELFNEKIRLGYGVITIEHAEEVIKRMGKPEEIFAATDSDYAKEEYKEKVVDSEYTKKRLFRNPDDRILGGVAGGLAAYLGWDPTAIRIALIVFMIFYGITIPVYLILWLIVPQANTVAEKLQMRGEKVTVENIGKTVTHGFEKVSNNVSDYINSEKPRTTIQKLCDLFVQVFGAIIKVLAIILSIVIFPPLLVLLFILFVVLIALVAGLLGGGFGLLYHFLPFAHWDSLAVYPEGWIIVSAICGILAIGIPVVGMIYAACGQLFKWKPMPTTAKWILVVLWIISVITMVVLGVNYGLPHWGPGGWAWSTASFPLNQINLW